MRAGELSSNVRTGGGSLKDRARFKKEMKIGFSSDERARRNQAFFLLVPSRNFKAEARHEITSATGIVFRTKTRIWFGDRHGESVRNNEFHFFF